MRCYLISIHALLAESDAVCVKGADIAAEISIHALLAESDLGNRCIAADRNISIHALLAESDGTASAKGHSDCNFYPRSPCGERLRPPAIINLIIRISIHALLAESDTIHLL